MKSLKITKGQSESIYRRRIDNTMAKRKRTKRQTTINHVSTKALTTGRRIHTYILAICVYNVFSVKQKVGNLDVLISMHIYVFIKRKAWTYCGKEREYCFQ